MRLDLTLIAAAIAFIVGFIAFWSNPSRRVNQLFLTLSIHAAIWLIFLALAVRGGDYGQIWMRTTTAVGAFIPLHLWFIKESIVNNNEPWCRMCRRSSPWVFVCASLAALTTTEWYVATVSSRESHGFGWGYYLYIVGIVAVYLALSLQTLRQTREQTGVHRLELRIVIFGGSVAVGTVLLLMALRALMAQPWLILLQPLVVLVFYTGTAVAITTSRIFDARQILLVSFQKLSLIGLVAVVAYVLDATFGLLMVEPLALAATTALALWFAAFLNGRLDRLFQFYPEAMAARQAAFDAARRETRVDRLENSFLAVLKGWSQSDHALVLSGSRDFLRGSGLEIRDENTVLETMRQLRWATPERLARERSTFERDEITKYLKFQNLGALVIGEGPTLSILVGVGVAASRRPYTYPQVTQLMELASIMEGALERAHFSAKAQHSEQLATVGLLGANLAHEIRNPLVSIKTFVQLLPTHHQDPVFREKFFRLIGEEVTRIDQLTEQLLDLASPRSYAASRLDLHVVLEASLDLVTAKAAGKNVQFFTDFRASPDTVFTDPAAAKQVMLNLCFNAIQAVESSGAGERWVKIATRNSDDGVEMAVADSGPGIAPEMQPQLFKPFQTNKSTGFGLGLAICRDILANLHASISVDPPVPGHGATFRVTYPCQPSSS